MKNILLATDFTPNSDRAIARAIRLARETNASLYILHVVPPYPLKRLKPLTNSLKEELQALIHKQAEAQRFGKEVKTYVNVVQAADIFNEILVHAHNTKADLIVLGMHGKARLRDYFVGTTMERIIRSGLKPVLVVKNMTSGGYQKIVSGIDYSPGSRAAFRMAKDLAPRADFYTVHAYEIPYYADKTYKYAISKALVEERHKKKMDQFLRNETSHFKKTRKNGEGKIIGQLAAGKPHKILTKKIKSLKADLLTIGANEDAGLFLPGTKLGGTAMEILFDPPCDVLVANNWKDMSQILI
ncbi:MAG: universal stress protein [Alphaproteobacteria bacterium PRO2]|nr:universal stress protein [Alphaproteobacteria bacterium PRO2]